MLPLTPQEKTVLFTVVTVIVLGSSLDMILKRFPETADILRYLEQPRSYPKTNLNTATFEKLIQIPYIGEFTAKRIIEHRNQHGAFVSVDQLKALKGVYEKNYAIFKNYLTVE